MCNQKLKVAVVTVDGMVTVCVAVSVWVVPKPSSQASHAPLCGGSEAELLITPAVRVQGAVLALPFSKPGLPSNCCAALEFTVSEMVVV